MLSSTDFKLNVIEAYKDGLIIYKGYDPSLSQTSKYLNEN
jgi:hypothetical protein